MRSVQPGMNVDRQRRKITHLIETADEDAARYLTYLLELFDAEVAAGLPRPAREFLAMFDEEFG